MGKLLEQLKNEPKGITGSIPVLQKILNEMNANDKADLLEALNDYNIKAASLVKALAARGIRISDSSIYRFRAGTLVHTIG